MYCASQVRWLLSLQMVLCCSRDRAIVIYIVDRLFGEKLEQVSSARISVPWKCSLRWMRANKIDRGKEGKGCSLPRPRGRRFERWPYTAEKFALVPDLLWVYIYLYTLYICVRTHMYTNIYHFPQVLHACLYLCTGICTYINTYMRKLCTNVHTYIYNCCIYYIHDKHVVVVICNGWTSPLFC